MNLHKNLHNGDAARYTGDAQYSGQRCTADSWSPKGKRVRIIVSIDGVPVLRSVKPENLERLGGG